MTMTNDTVVEECQDTDNMPEIKYNLVPIKQIADLEPNAVIGLYFQSCINIKH